jgi:hypothetical protein
MQIGLHQFRQNITEINLNDENCPNYMFGRTFPRRNVDSLAEEYQAERAPGNSMNLRCIYNPKEHYHVERRRACKVHGKHVYMRPNFGRHLAFSINGK